MSENESGTTGTDGGFLESEGLRSAIEYGEETGIGVTARFMDAGFDVVDLDEGEGSDKEKIARAVDYGSGTWAEDIVRLAYVFNWPEDEAVRLARKIVGLSG